MDVAVLTRAVRACRFLLRQAAMLDLSEAALAEDLARLGDTGEVRAALLPGYATVKKVVRSEVVRGALVDHGKVVERVAWRVDHVASSNRGANLDVPVAVLSLWYREGERQDHVTLQLPPTRWRSSRRCVAGSRDAGYVNDASASTSAAGRRPAAAAFHASTSPSGYGRSGSTPAPCTTDPSGSVKHATVP